MKFSLLFLLLATNSLFAQTSQAPGAETRVIALENAWGQAEKLGDVKALDSLLDDNMVYIRFDGAIWNKEQYLASLNDRTSHEDEAVNENMTARVFGNTERRRKCPLRRI